MNALTASCSPARSRAVGELAEATAKWGCDVPDDPGLIELADLLALVAGHLPEDHAARAEAAASLEMAVEHLRAADRLGGLLPLVTLHHLRLALQYERSARQNPTDRPGPDVARDRLQPVGELQGASRT